MATPGPVTVMGAGAIGCRVGGRLQAAGVEVHFVGRAPALAALAEHGLDLSGIDGKRVRIEGSALRLHTEPPPADLVLLCVKSGATAEAARQLPAGSLVLSLQNGISNPGIARAAATTLTVLAGMVGFNVVELGPGRFHRAIEAELAAQDDPALRSWQPFFAAAGMPLALHAEMAPVQWGKLLLNLNNPVNALSGLPLREQLMERDYRRVFAALIDEALAALRRAAIVPAQMAPIPPRWMPALLRLPDAIFRRLAARMLRIDDKARSSMACDLERGRRTEVDALCGEVVRLARSEGGDAPLNARLVELVENDPRPRSGAALRAELGV